MIIRSLLLTVVYNLKKKETQATRDRFVGSSDSNAVLEELQKAIQGITNQTDKAIVAKGITGHILQNPNVYKRVLFDQEVLARTDALVITGGSTYGFVAMIKLGKLQYSLDFTSDNTDSEKVKQCKKVTFSDPGETSGNLVFRK